MNSVCITPTLLQVATELLPFLGGDLVGWDSKDVEGNQSKGQGSCEHRKYLSHMTANVVPLIISEWRNQDVDNQNARLLSTVHMVAW